MDFVYKTMREFRSITNKLSCAKCKGETLVYKKNYTGVENEHLYKELNNLLTSLKYTYEETPTEYIFKVR